MRTNVATVTRMTMGEAETVSVVLIESERVVAIVTGRGGSLPVEAETLDDALTAARQAGAAIGLPRGLLGAALTAVRATALSRD